MDKVSTAGLMAGGMKGITMKIRNKDKVLTLGQMAKSTLEAGKTASKKEKENSPTPNYKEEVELG